MTAPDVIRGGHPVPVGEVLARFLRASGLKDKLRTPEVYECWPEVAGPEASRHSRVVGFNNCIVYVEVDSAPWLHRLAAFKKRELLLGFRQAIQGACVKDIRFKIGRGGAAPVESRNFRVEFKRGDERGARADV